jgi:hypothetical protein
MDDRDTFDRRCVQEMLQLKIVSEAIRLAKSRNDIEAAVQLVQKKHELMTQSMDYVFQHMDYLDEPTRDGWYECAAQLPLVIEREKEELGIDDGEIRG